MNKSVRVLRVLLPILFVAFLVLIALSYRARVQQDDPVTSGERTDSLRGDEQPQLVTYAFEDTQSIGGRTVSRIRARRTMGFTSGWYALEDAEITVFREDGGQYRMVAPNVQFRLETKEAELKGDVLVTSSDGLRLATRDLKFDGNRMVNQVPLEFRFGSWSGKAGGVDLDVKQDRLRLFNRVQGQLAPANPAEVPMTLEAAEGVFLRESNRAEFSGTVVFRKDPDTVRSDVVVAQFDQSGRILTGLEGRGNVVMRLSGSASSASATGSGEKQIQADRYVGETGPLGELRALTVLGEQQPARAHLAGPPVRNISAGTMRVFLEGGELRELRAIGSVILTEAIPTGVRTMHADETVVNFNPVTRSASGAVIRGNVRYDDPRSQATAGLANYDIGGDRMVLTSPAGSLPTLRADGHSLRGTLVELAPREGSIRVNGNVNAQLIPREGAAATASGTAMFPSSATPVFVNSDSAVLRQSTQTAFFKGNVRAWQEKNTLLADELLVQGAGELLQAKTGVRTVLYNARAESASTPVNANADALTAKKQDRAVELTGNVKIDETTRTLTAGRALLFFSAERKLERVEAHTGVTVEEKATNRRGKGEKAVYHLADRMLFLDGSPAVLTDPRGTVRGEQIVFDIAKNQVNIRSTTSPAESTYNPQ